MGTHLYESGRCKYCGNLTHTTCDGCRAFVCIDHRIKVRVPHSYTKTFTFCQECLKKHKNPIHVVRINHRPAEFDNA